MKNVLKALLLIFVVGAFFSACQKEVVEMEAIDLKTSEVISPEMPAGEATQRGIPAEYYLGNFVSSDDDQVCYDMEALGYIGEVTTEMRGFKIDPPVNYSDGNVNVTLMDKGKYLNWTATGETVVHAFIIKGGNGFNVFNYVKDPVLYLDNGLHSPYIEKINKKGPSTWQLPQISHYNVCYTPPLGEDQGCTPGYWRNHADRWVGVAPGDDFDTTFGVNLFNPDITLGMAITTPQTYGTDAFHAVAAILNAYSAALASVGGDDYGQYVKYPYSVDKVKEMVQNGEFDDLKTANEFGCPLSGTPAQRL